MYAQKTDGPVKPACGISDIHITPILMPKALPAPGPVIGEPETPGHHKKKHKICTKQAYITVSGKIYKINNYGNGSNTPIGIIQTGIIKGHAEYEYYWTDMMAASTAVTIPIVVLFIFLQKYYIAGLTGGAVKS